MAILVFGRITFVVDVVVVLNCLFTFFVRFVKIDHLVTEKFYLGC